MALGDVMRLFDEVTAGDKYLLDLKERWLDRKLLKHCLCVLSRRKMIFKYGTGDRVYFTTIKHDKARTGIKKAAAEKALPPWFETDNELSFRMGYTNETPVVGRIFKGAMHHD